MQGGVWNYSALMGISRPRRIRSCCLVPNTVSARRLNTYQALNHYVLVVIPDFRWQICHLGYLPPCGSLENHGEKESQCLPRLSVSVMIDWHCLLWREKKAEGSANTLSVWRLCTSWALWEQEARYSGGSAFQQLNGHQDTLRASEEDNSSAELKWGLLWWRRFQLMCHWCLP